MLTTPVTRLDDFSGGLVTKGSEISLKPSQSPDCVNVYSDIFKSCKKRGGYAKVNLSTAAGTCNGIYNYVRTESTQYLLALWTATLKKMDVVTSAWDGTWDPVSADANVGTALSNSVMYNTTFGTDCIITAEGRDVPQRYDPVDDANYVDIDWETSHCYVAGDTSTPTTGTGAYLKITVDSTVFDNVDVRSLATVATVVSAINAHAGLAAKGYAYADSSGYLRIVSNTRGSSGSVAVEDGSSDSGDAQGEATEVLFAGTTATGTTIDTNIAVSAKYSIEWYNYLWLANTAAYPDRIYHSTAGDVTTYSALDYQTITTSGDIGITGLATLRGRMYVFKKWSIHRVTYLGGVPLFDVRQVGNIGTITPKSIVYLDIPGQGECLIFLGSDSQLYKFDGYNTVVLTEAISTYNGISNYCMLGGSGVDYGINPAYLSKCHAVHYTLKHWYVLFFPKGEDITCKDAIVFDYFTNSFWPFSIDEDGDDIFAASCISDNGNGLRRLYTAGVNYAWLFDTGNDDDGGNIDAYWTSPKLDFGSEVQAKIFRNVVLTTSSAATTPSFQHRTDWVTSYSTAVALVTATIEHVYDIPRFDELYQWKIRDDSTSVAFELLRASIMAQPRGVGR